MIASIRMLMHVCHLLLQRKYFGLWALFPWEVLLQNWITSLQRSIKDVLYCRRRCPSVKQAHDSVPLEKAISDRNFRHLLLLVVKITEAFKEGGFSVSNRWWSDLDRSWGELDGIWHSHNFLQFQLSFHKNNARHTLRIWSEDFWIGTHILSRLLPTASSVRSLPAHFSWKPSIWDINSLTATRQHCRDSHSRYRWAS